MLFHPAKVPLKVFQFYLKFTGRAVVSNNFNPWVPPYNIGLSKE